MKISNLLCLLYLSEVYSSKTIYKRIEVNLADRSIHKPIAYQFAITFRHLEPGPSVISNSNTKSNRWLEKEFSSLQEFIKPFWGYLKKGKRVFTYDYWKGPIDSIILPYLTDIYSLSNRISYYFYYLSQPLTINGPSIPLTSDQFKFMVAKAKEFVPKELPSYLSEENEYIVSMARRYNVTLEAISNVIDMDYLASFYQTYFSYIDAYLKKALTPKKTQPKELESDLPILIYQNYLAAMSNRNSKSKNEFSHTLNGILDFQQFYDIYQTYLSRQDAQVKKVNYGPEHFLIKHFSKTCIMNLVERAMSNPDLHKLDHQNGPCYCKLVVGLDLDSSPTMVFDTILHLLQEEMPLSSLKLNLLACNPNHKLLVEMNCEYPQTKN